MSSDHQNPFRLDTEQINTIVEQQLAGWPEARSNFMQLGKAERKRMSWGALEGAVQHNPARIKSTGAAVDKKSIESRPCFLCESNRPEQQTTIAWTDNWQLLVNPYPILPIHFTIVSRDHTPQDAVPLDMAAMAEAAPDLAIFYNGAKAGASAPDHKHLQAVLKSELPLLEVAEKYHAATCGGFMSSEDMGIEVPFQFISGVITPDLDGMKMLAKVPGAFGIDEHTGKKERGLVNAFFWMDSRGLLRCLIVPRKAHRPRCWGEEDSKRFVISPGAIDMTGLIIAPRREDFERLDAEKCADIYGEVAFQKSLPQEVKDYFGV